MGGTTPIGAFVLGQVCGRLDPQVALVTFGAATAAAVAAVGLRRRRPDTVGVP